MALAKVEAAGTVRATRVPGGLAEVAVLAYPAVLQTLSDTLMQVVDSAIVGRLGVTELGAVGFGGIWVWTALCAFVGAATGVQTFVAQAYGAGDLKHCGRWAWQGVYALVLPAVLWIGALGLSFGWLVELLGPSSNLQHLSTSYAHARLCGAPAVVASVAFSSFFRGIGDTRTPLLVTVIANVLNAVTTYGLVFGRFGLPAWGVMGAGVGTALSNWTFAVIMLACLLRPGIRRLYATAPVRPELQQMRRLVRTSAPIGGQWVLDMVSFALFSTIIARMGDAQMAASQAMIQLLSLSFMQMFGISIAAGALVGQYIGGRDLASAERSHRSALQLGVALGAGVAVLFLTVPDLLLGIFTTDAAVIAMGRPLLALGALFQLIDAVGIIVGGSLRGAGDTRYPFFVSALLAWVVRLPLAYLFAVVFELGVTGAWCGELIYVTALGCAWLLRFRSGVWRTVRI